MEAGMKRKLFLCMIGFALIIGAAAPAFSQNYENERDNIGGFNTVIINGQAISLTYDIIHVDGHMLFPVRSLFDTLGFVVEWDGDERTVTLTRDGNVITIFIGGDMFTIDDKPYQIEIPARIINDRTFVPINNLLSAIGYELNIDFLIRAAGFIREEGIVCNNELDALFLTLIAQETIRRVLDAATNIIDLNQGEIAEIVGSVIGEFEHYSYLVADDLFIIIWDEDWEIAYATVSGDTLNIITVFFAAGDFWPHEAEFYFYRDWAIAVGFNHALAERGIEAVPAYQHHIVAAGDTLSSIAMLYFGRSDFDIIDLILAANDMTFDDALLVGQVLVIPIL